MRQLANELWFEKIYQMWINCWFHYYCQVFEILKEIIFLNSVKIQKGKLQKITILNISVKFIFVICTKTITIFGLVIK